MKKITDPDIQNTLRDAALKKDLIIFVGAGVSKLCGLPLWDAAANSMIENFMQYADKNFDFYALDRFYSRIVDPREKFTVIRNLYRDVGKEDIFYSDLENLFNKIPEEKKTYFERIRNVISKLARICVTTNVDTILDFKDRDVLYDEDKIKAYDFKNHDNKVTFHMHGSINDIKKSVFTLEDYLERYKSGSTVIKQVQNIFRDTTKIILFVGYGFRDLQLLDLIFRDPSTINNTMQRMFYLEGFFKEDDTFYKAWASYHKIYGIQLLAYEKNINNYNQLIDDLEKIAKKYDEKQEIFNATSNTKQIIDNYSKGDSLVDFMAQYNSLDRERKGFLLNRIEQSIYASDILLKLLDIYNINDVLPIDKSDFNAIADMPLLYLLSRIQIDYSAKIGDYMDSIISIFNIPKFYEDKLLCGMVFNVLFKYPILFKKAEVKYFIKSYCKCTKGDELLYTFMNNKTSIDSCSNSTQLSLFKNFFEVLIKNPMEYIERFYATSSKRYVQRYPDAVIEIILKVCREMLDSDNSYFNLSRDTFASINSMNNIRNIEYYKIKLLIDAMSVISDTHAYKLCKYWFNKESNFYKNLAIYYVSMRYNLLKNEFWERLDQLNIIDYYSEIYMLVKAHIAEFNKEERDRIKEFAANINYSNVYYSKFCKLDLLNLLLKDSMEVERSSLIKLTKEEYDGYKNSPPPESRSKRIWLTNSKISLDEDYEEELFNCKSIDELIEKLRIAKNDFRKKETVRAVFEKLDTKFSLKKWALDHVNDKNVVLPKFLCALLTRYDAEMSVKEAFSLIKSVVNKQGKPKAGTDSEYISSLYYVLSNDRLNVDESTKDEINKFVLNVEVETFMKNDEISSSLSDETNNIIFRKYAVLIQTMTKNNKELVLEKLAKEMNMPYGAHVKSAITSNMLYLWENYRQWVKDNFSQIFEGTEIEQNVIIAAHSFSTVLDEEFVELLIQNNLIGKIVNNNDISALMPYYCAILLTASIIVKNRKIMEELFASKIIIDSINVFFAERYDSTNLKEIIKMVKQKKLASTRLGIEYIKYCTAKKIETDVDCVISLFSLNNNLYYTDDLISALNDSDIKNDQKQNIVEMFLQHFEGQSWCYGSIKDLINSIAWDGDRKNTLIKWLCNEHPWLFDVFKDDTDNKDEN